MEKPGKRPTHLLFVKKKTGGPSLRVGAGWLNEWGGISIQLHPCTVLTDRDDVYINLYENRDKDIDKGEPPPLADSDIPF